MQPRSFGGIVARSGGRKGNGVNRRNGIAGRSGGGGGGGIRNRDGFGRGWGGDGSMGGHTYGTVSSGTVGTLRVGKADTASLVPYNDKSTSASIGSDLGGNLGQDLLSPDGVQTTGGGTGASHAGAGAAGNDDDAARGHAMHSRMLASAEEEEDVREESLQSLSGARPDLQFLGTNGSIGGRTRSMDGSAAGYAESFGDGNVGGDGEEDEDMAGGLGIVSAAVGGARTSGTRSIPGSLLLAAEKESVYRVRAAGNKGGRGGSGNKPGNKTRRMRQDASSSFEVGAVNFADMNGDDLKAFAEEEAARGMVGGLRSDVACLTKLVIALAVLLLLALAAVVTVLALVVGQGQELDRVQSDVNLLAAAG